MLMSLYARFLEVMIDARSWADQGREDLAALREEKTL